MQSKKMIEVQNPILKAPFPWFGGKSRVARGVWERFGEVQNYVEPFAGSLAVLLGRPTPPKLETVNDKDCYLANFWRALASDPEQVAFYADWPVNEADLHARHLWLVNREEFRERMKTDPDYYDVKIAGWWAWGLSCWIGSGWCKKISRQLPHLKHAGMGIHRKRNNNLLDYFEQLANRLRFVRVCCGDWKRVTNPAVSYGIGMTGVSLDPPYDQEIRDSRIYSEDEIGISNAVAKWAIENGENPLLRIALCGYEGEHSMPSCWSKHNWTAKGGYGLQGNGRGRENHEKEVIWFSPHCLQEWDLWNGIYGAMT